MGGSWIRERRPCDPVIKHCPLRLSTILSDNANSSCRYTCVPAIRKTPLFVAISESIVSCFKASSRFQDLRNRQTASKDGCDIEACNDKCLSRNDSNCLFVVLGF